jgi:hypothetical protein
MLELVLAWIFHRGDVQRAQALGCRDAMDVECICLLQNGFGYVG